jgi:hypothetical protein
MTSEEKSHAISVVEWTPKSRQIASTRSGRFRDGIRIDSGLVAVAHAGVHGDNWDPPAGPLVYGHIHECGDQTNRLGLGSFQINSDITATLAVLNARILMMRV